MEKNDCRRFRLSSPVSPVGEKNKLIQTHTHSLVHSIFQGNFAFGNGRVLSNTLKLRLKQVFSCKVIQEMD